MDKLTAIFASRDVRGWIYNVTIAGLAVAMMYGLLNGQQAAAWLGLVAAVVGLARGNLTPTDGEIEKYDPNHDIPRDDYDPRHDG